MQVSSSFLPSLPPSLPPFVHFFWSLKSSIRILPCLVENRTRYVHLSLPPSLPPFLLPPSPSSTSDGKRRLPSPSLPLQARRLTAPTHPPSPPPFLPPSLQTQLDQRWKAQAASPFSAASGKTEEETSKKTHPSLSPSLPPSLSPDPARSAVESAGRLPLLCRLRQDGRGDKQGRGYDEEDVFGD